LLPTLYVSFAFSFPVSLVGWLVCSFQALSDDKMCFLSRRLSPYLLLTSFSVQAIRISVRSLLSSSFFSGSVPHWSFLCAFCVVFLRTCRSSRPSFPPQVFLETPPPFQFYEFPFFPDWSLFFPSTPKCVAFPRFY